MSALFRMLILLVFLSVFPVYGEDSEFSLPDDGKTCGYVSPTLQSRIELCKLEMRLNDCHTVPEDTRKRNCINEARNPMSEPEEALVRIYSCAKGALEATVMVPVRFAQSGWSDAEFQARYYNGQVIQGCKRHEQSNDVEVVRKCKNRLLEEFPDLTKKYEERLDQTKYEEILNSVHDRLDEIRLRQPSLAKLIRDNPDNFGPALNKEIEKLLAKFNLKPACYTPQAQEEMGCAAAAILIGGAAAGMKLIKSFKNARALATRSVHFSDRELAKLNSRFSKSRIDEAQSAIEKMNRGETLSVVEAERAAEVFNSIGKRGLIVFHKTKPENLALIQNSGRMHTKPTSPQIYGLAHNKSNFMNTGQVSGSGIVLFQGKAAKLFSNRPAIGVPSAYGRWMGHQVTQRGKLIIDESEMIDGALVIKRAHMEPLKPSEMAMGAVAPALELASDGLWLGLAGGVLYYQFTAD